MRIPSMAVEDLHPPGFRLHREHGRSDYLFVLFKSPAKVLIHEEYVDVDRGSCVLFGPHRIQSYYPAEGKSFLHDWIHFVPEGEYERKLVEMIPCNELIPVLLSDQITEILSAIKKEVGNAGSRHKQEIINSYANVFLHRLINELEQGKKIENRQHYQLLYDLRHEIYRNPQREWTIDVMSKMTCLSRFYLQHKYKEFFDISCTADVIHARISTAKAMLISTDFPISLVAEQCGYRSMEHFVRQFKKLVGVTPGKFRNG